MSYNISANIKVNADTSHASSALKQLQQQLQSLTDMSNVNGLGGMNIDQKILKAAQAAQLLKTQIAEAMNPKTGTLDLSKFRLQLQQSGMTLKQYQQQLSQLGPAGNQAFAQLASSIAQAQMPVRNMNTLTQRLFTTFKNTLKWQLASGLIHGIVSGMSKMVSYAKELDTSLNNIRIVTSASSDKMAQFAVQANKAAKELNTTTTKYTNASLIYYQQGLSDKEVEARTRTTIKLANVTRQSTEEASNQLTAIWNNFAEGTDNLEHFADVITALGAATASSSSEIATGLQKFAAIADTVGLSYENAAAAMATITATTRQSADTVGTGLRTLFSRLQSLKLGETLEDGVDLDKYSKALKTVGVNILDAQGELKGMDEILTGVMDKWDDLSRAQQNALAKTVGGIRQYATFIALMDQKDFFKQNVEIAQNSDGVLQQQAEIYGTSWEAASNRAQAAAETIYSKLVNGKDFAEMIDGFSKFLEVLDGMIDGLGGLKGVLVTLGALATNIFGKQIATSIDNMTVSMANFGALGRRHLANFQTEATTLAMNALGPAHTAGRQAQAAALRNNLMDSMAYAHFGKNMNETQLTGFRGIMDVNNQVYQRAVESGKSLDTSRDNFFGRAREVNEVNGERLEAWKNDEGKRQRAINKELNKFKRGTGTGKNRIIPNNEQIAQKEAELKNKAEQKKPKTYDNKDLAQMEQDFQQEGRAQNAADLLRRVKDSNLKGDAAAIVNPHALKDVRSAALDRRNKLFDEWDITRKGIKEQVGTKKVPVVDEKGNPVLKKGKQVMKDEINYEEYFKGNKEVQEASIKAAKALDAEAKTHEFTTKAVKKNGEMSEKNSEILEKQQQANEKLTNNALKQTEEQGLETQNDGLTGRYKNLRDTEYKGLADQMEPEITEMRENDRQHTRNLGEGARTREGFSQNMGEQANTASLGQAVTGIAGAATAAASAVMMLANAFDVLGNKSATSSQKLGAVMSIVMSLGMIIPAVVNIVQLAGKQIQIAGTQAQLSFGWIGVILAAITAVIVGIVALCTQEDKAVTKMRQAGELAAALSDDSQAIIDKVKGIKDAFDKYDTVYQALEGCIKYSQEWYDTLDKVREASMDIMNDYPELAKKYKDLFVWDEELGTYVVNEDVRPQIEEDLRLQEIAATAGKNYGSYMYSQTKINNDKENLMGIYSNEVSKHLLGWLREITGDFDSDELFNKYFLPWATGLGNQVYDLKTGEAVIKSFTDYLNTNGFIKNSEFSDYTKYLEEKVYPKREYDEDNSYLAGISGMQERAGTAVQKFITDQYDEIQQINSTEEEIKNSRTNNTKMAISAAVQGTGTTEDVAEFAATLLQSSQDAQIAALEKTIEDQAYAGPGDNSDKVIAKYGDKINKWLEMTGRSEWELQSDAIEQVNGQKKFLFTDEKGQDQSIPMKEVLEGAIIYGTAMNADDYVKRAQNIVNDFKENAKENLNDSEVANNLASWVGTKRITDNMSLANINAFKSQYNGEDDSSTYENYENFLKTSFGKENVTDVNELNTFAKDLGYDNWATMVKNFQSEVDRVAAENETAINQFAGKVGLETGDTAIAKFEKLNAVQLKNLSSVYDSIDIFGEGEGSSALKKSLTGIFKGAKTEQLFNFNDLINQTDWSSLTATEDFMSGLTKIFGNKELEKLLDGTDLEEFAKGLREIQLAAKPTEIGKFATQMQNIQSLLKNGIKPGQVISQKDMQEKYSVFDFSKLGYTDTAGNFTFTKGSEEVKEEFQRQSKQYAEDAARSYKNNQNKNLLAKGASLKEVKQAMADVGYTEEEIESFSDRNLSIPNSTAQQNMLNSKIEQINEKYKNNNEDEYKTRMKAIAENAVGLEHLNQIIQENSDAFADMSDEEMEALRTRALLNEAEFEGLDPAEVYEYAKAQQEYNEGLKDLVQDEDLRRESLEFSKSILKKRKALEEFATAVTKYTKVLKEFAKGEKEAFNPDVAEGLTKYKKLLKDLFGGTEASYTTDFIKENLDEIEKMAKGDEEAFKKVGQARVKSLIDSYNLSEGIDAPSVIKQLQDAMADDKVEIGTVLNFDEAQANSFLNTLQGFVDSNAIDASKMLDLAAAGGWEPVTKKVTVGSTVDDSMKQGGTVYAVSADGTVTPVQLDGESKITGEGQTSYDVIVGWQKTGPGSSGGGGGGGGQKKKDHKKPDIGTRYHKVKAKQSNNDIKKQDVSKSKDRAFGAEKIKQAEKEIELQKEAIDLQRQYVDEITDYLAGDRLKMLEAFTPDKLGFDLGFNIQIDEDGVITNYRQLEERLLEEENHLIDLYNEGKLDDEKYQEAQKKIDEAREYLKIYEETRDLYEEQWSKLKEYLDELQDKALELTKIKIDLDISISDDTLKLLDYFIEKIDDDAYQAAQSLALLTQKAEENANRINTYQTGLAEILASKGFDINDLANLTDGDLAAANFTEKEIQQIREWSNALLDTNKELLKMRDTVIDKVIDAFNAVNEKIEKSIDIFDHYNTVLTDYKEIVELLNIRATKEQKQLINDLNRATLHNSQLTAAAARKSYEAMISASRDAHAQYEEIVKLYGEDSAEARKWEKVINETDDKMREAEEKWLDSRKEALQQAQDIFEASVESAVQAFDKAISSTFGDLEYLQSAYNRSRQTTQQYLQDYDRLYELSKLSRNISAAIDDTDTIKGKERLRALQAEINKLQEDGTKLSEYDVQVLEKKFELEKARLALDDAQNAKSQVRLQRDSEGNWGYIYTANEDEVEKAEQEYEDKLHEYQKLNDDYINTLQERILETKATYKDTLQEIATSALTPEEKQARVNELNEWFESELNYFNQQINNALENQHGTLDRYYQAYNDLRAQLVDTWPETTMSLLTGFNNIDNYLTNIQDAAHAYVAGLYEAWQQLAADMAETEEIAGSENIMTEVASQIQNIGESSENTMNSISDLTDELNEHFTAALQEALTWEQQFAEAIKEAVEYNEQLVASLDEVIARLRDIESSNPELEKQRTAYMAAEKAHEEFIQKNGENAVDEAWEEAKKQWQEYLEKTFGIQIVKDTGTDQIPGAATGAYTGDWGDSSGRIAVLHRKELVMDADDTEKFLNAAKILRTLDLQADLFSQGLGKFIIPQVPSTHNDILDQNVKIEASFPNVTSHTEIEEAFNNLINKASQYANRKGL